ncbi:phage tail tape measure protein [Enterococcus faecium]|uniref:phage tail tape measure protein n=1 Tax=Enterococcus faecium TaxID=1352 RepID=UPI0019DF1199|nr:phage tail tape measure protein [Enterococcus faecium]EGP5218263.1 phage tail tape measure protein [Enterococcus faecium]EME7162211.1 phage tail tape measure protein [Enterococcus faecium]MDK4350420.1 phage tail tape measure protein [Enterococcus faecium]MDK4363216.1 phage tail tape measure protein [Enterococcus faecium]MDK4394706.1 phage tail tape measure protein [Enterococcus faecium]
MANGKPLGNMIIKLDLDSSAFSSGLAGAKNAVNHQMKAMKSQMQVMNSSGNSLGALQAKYEGLGGVLQANEKLVKELTKDYKDSFDANGNATASTAKYANQLNQATARSASYESQMKTTVGQIARMKVETEGFTGKLKANSDVLINSGKKIESFGKGISGMGTALSVGVTAPILAGATAVTTAAISWESAFAGVKKTNDEVVDSNGNVVYSYSDLEKGLRDLATKLPASHQEIANVAEAAGQLGIKTENVVSFTKTMVDMGESTNMSAETAATSLARLANITKLPQDKFSNLGAAIVDLGNNFATTESEITEMALRLAGAGSQIGLSQGDILGLSAALSSVGIEAEMGGSAISKVMVNMQVAAKTGLGQMEDLTAKTGKTRRELELMSSNSSKDFKDLAGSIGMTTSEMTGIMKASSNLENFGKIAGMSAQDFKKAFEEDAIGAIGKFIEGLGNAESQGTSAIEMLDEMGISEVRLRDSLLRAGNASDLFKDAVKRSNKAFGDNVALTNEANKRYETTESKLKMLKNEAVDAAIDLGGPFVDALRDGLEASKPLIKNLGNMAKAFSDMSDDQQRNIIKWVGLVAAAGPALKLLGTGTSVIGKVTSSTGKLTKGIVDLAAKAAEKKAMNTFASTVTAAGTAASSAAGASGVGAMTTSLGLLSPALLGIVGVGGALALGYGAWKTFGEEAWNSSQRVKEWGSDVGSQVDSTLDTVKEKTNETSGQFGLMVQGFDQDTGPMVKNFETIGATIESSLTKKVEGLDNLLKNLPGTVTDSMKEIVENEKEMNQSALEKIQENNDRIKEIREKASKEHRDISVAEAQMISDLSKNTAEQYVNTLDVSAEQRKAILNSMTGDVSQASKEQAETWLKSLGEQRNASQNHTAQMRKEQEKWLKDWGYNLDGEFAQKYLAEWDKINDATTDGFDSQIAAIVEKYPELADKIHLATGEVIAASANTSQYLIEDNQKLLDNAGYMADKLAENAKKNADTLKWVAKEGTDGAKEWNSLELLDKEGNVKTNAPEIIKEASKNITTWNNLKMVLHDANIDSNAKKMIGEAAIANDLWRGMAWEDKEAVLQDEFSINVYKALESSGKWDELDFEQKKAVLYSNTPEVMAETLFNLGLWNDYQPEIKNLNAKNYDFLQTLSKSEEKLKIWNETPVDIKELFAKNTDFLNKIFSSEEKLNLWNSIPDSEKKLLADNMDFLTKISTSKETLNQWNQLPTDQKNILANNEDLLNKIFASEESFNVWKAIPDPVKRMLGDNVDILTKVKDGTISIEDYNKNVLPLLKKLFGDNSSLTGAVGDASAAIDNYNKNVFLNDKTAVGHDEASQAAKDAFEAFNIFQTKIPDKITKTVSADFIGPMPNAKGTNFHPGGAAMVNDQKGSTYEELVTLPNGEAFIPKGRNVVLDLPRGSKVLKASKTKQLVSKYADGIGNITTISTAPNFDALILAINELTAVLRSQQPISNQSTTDTKVAQPIIPDALSEKSDQYLAIGSEWLTNLMNGWNSVVPQYMSSETLFITNYLNALKSQNDPNYLQGATWNKNLMNGWNSLTGTFIATINSFCNQAMVTLRNYNTPMYNNGRTWQQNNLNGWNSLYGSFIARVNQLGNDSINNLRSKNGGFYNAGSFLLQSLINGMNSMGNSLASTMNSVANTMVGGMGKGVNGVISGVNYVLKEVESSKSIGNWAIPQYAKGTEGHPGGLAMINDQKGFVHEEYVQMPDGRGFIAKGRDLLVNLPKGAQVLNASLTKKLKERLNVPRYENGVGNLDIVDLLDDEKRMLEFLTSKVDFSGINERWLDMTKSGTNLMSKAANTMLQSKLSEFFTHGNFDGAVNANGVYQYLVDVAQKVMGKFPGLTVTSGYRAGDAYYHGKRQAIDLAYPGISGDPRYTAAANYAFEKFPSKIAYVITNGRVRDRAGLSGTGASGQWTNWPDGDHFDHIHLNGSMGSGDIFTGGGAGGGGVARWRSYVSKALKMNGLPATAAYINAWMSQIQTESGGNERAIGGTDGLAEGNATGLLQTKPGTFAANAFPGHGNIMNGFDNMLAAINYAKKRYGVAGMLQVIGRGHGYANGGLITKDGLYRAGEGNKPEMVIPLTRKTRAIELMGQALAFLSGDDKKRSNTTNTADNSAELVTLIKQQQKQHNELMMILRAILGKDLSLKSSDIGQAANHYMGSDLNKLRYTNGGV